MQEGSPAPEAHGGRLTHGAWALVAVVAALVAVGVPLAFALGRSDPADPTPAPSPTEPSLEPSATPTVVTEANSPTDDDWLHTDGNRIVDSEGNPVWITGANWFGFNLTTRVLNGLWAVNLEDTLTSLSARGINTIRVPISAELLLEWRDGDASAPTNVNYAVNPDLQGKTTLEVFDAFLAACKDRGVKVIPDIHSAEADDDGHLTELWYTDRVSAADFVAAWEWFAARYAGDDTVIGYDLKNEPHGVARWDASDAPENWRSVAEDLGNRLLAINPNALIIVEGVEVTPRPDGGSDYGWWGGNLRAAREFPVVLADATRLVYSPHEYGPLVYEQPWFRERFTAESLRADVWDPYWLYLHTSGTAPLFIGEWGGRLGEDPRQDAWMVALRDLIVDQGIAHTFWCVNPESHDTGGLLQADWTSWDEEKYALLEPALWQDREGRFVSLDHATPLPGGITVSQYYADGNVVPGM